MKWLMPQISEDDSSTTKNEASEVPEMGGGGDSLWLSASWCDQGTGVFMVRDIRGIGL